MVEDLSEVGGVVAVCAEVLGQSDDVRIEFTEFDVIMSDAAGIGAKTGEKAGTRGAADGLLAVCSVEEESGLRQRV